MSKQSLEQVLSEYFSPAETKKAKGAAKYVITVNGQTIATRIKGRKDLERTLQSIALEDARKSTTTTVLVYKLEGEANVAFDAKITVGKKDEEGEA